MEQALQTILSQRFGTDLDTATAQQIYLALMLYTKERMADLPPAEGKRKLYYVSAEFLIGKLLSNNLINLGLFDEAEALLARHGHNLTDIEEAENEPSLGNGGLGRLAACFLDSIASLGLCGDGAGLNYHEGLFYQKLEDNKQREYPNPWITPESWLTDTGVRFTVPFEGFSLNAVMYDVCVPGYNGQRNALHLFDADAQTLQGPLLLMLIGAILLTRQTGRRKSPSSSLSNSTRGSRTKAAVPPPVCKKPLTMACPQSGHTRLI